MQHITEPALALFRVAERSIHRAPQAYAHGFDVYGSALRIAAEDLMNARNAARGTIVEAETRLFAKLDSHILNLSQAAGMAVNGRSAPKATDIAIQDLVWPADEGAKAAINLLESVL